MNGEFKNKTDNLTFDGGYFSTVSSTPVSSASSTNSNSLADLQRNASAYLEEVRLEAKRIIEEASQKVFDLKNDFAQELAQEQSSLESRALELENARKVLESDFQLLEKSREELRNEAFEEARSEGYKAGFDTGSADGFREGEKRAREEINVRVEEETKKRLAETRDQALEPLRDLVRELSGARRALLKNWEENILQIAAAIAYQTILREPTVLKEVAIDLLHEALELAMNCAALKIKMNPNDVKLLRDQIDVVLEETGNLAKAEIISDPRITAGGCVVETSLGVVDERLESRLERIVAELSD